MLTERQLIKRLHDTGHFWNPDYPDCLNVGLADLELLTLNDQVARYALGSWQASDINFQTLAGMKYGREVMSSEAKSFGDVLTEKEGPVGIVTQFMSEMDRCAIPDFTPPPNAEFHYDDPFLQGAVESMQRFHSETGTGSFQIPGCDPLRKNKAREHSIVVNANMKNAPAFVVEHWDEIVLKIRKCAAEKGLSARYVKDGPRESTHYFEFLFLAGGTIGINYFPQGSTCNQVVYGKIDSSFNTSVAGHANLWAHEQVGHGIGLGHYRGGYMNASLVIIDPLTIVGDPTESKWNQYFDGKPIPLDDDTPPQPPPTSGPEFIGELTGDHNAAGQIAIRGVIDVVVKDGLKPGKYPQILVPSDTLGRFHFEPKS